MALPRGQDPYESYTDQIVYFSARLAANPDTAPLAEAVDALVTDVDASYDALRHARRAEIRARARRDHEDGLGDRELRRYRRRSDVVGDKEITGRLFPKGISHMVAPRGRPQLDRIAALGRAIEELAISPRVAAHEDVDELKELLDKGQGLVAELSGKLTPVIEAWESQTLEVSRAVDAFRFVRADGLRRLGAVIGELRALLGGDGRAAYEYTYQARSVGAGGFDEDELGELDELDEGGEDGEAG